MAMKRPTVDIAGVIASLALLLLAGTLGYMSLEGYSALDSLFMTVITLSTVGFETLRPLSDAGKLFTIVLIVAGVGIFSYHLTRLFSFVVERGSLEALERRRMEKQLRDLSGHYILCGYGRIGSVVAKEFAKAGKTLLVVERRAEEVDKLLASGVFAVPGDAREEDVLKRAGVLKAKGLIVLLPSDADTLYVVLAARDINPDLLIVARANEASGERRLLQAGTSKVICPYREGGKRIAGMILNPNITDFIEMATEKDNLELQMVEFSIGEHHKLAEKSLTETNLLKTHGLLVVAIKRTDGTMTFNPAGSTRIHAGDALIVLGPALKDKLF